MIPALPPTIEVTTSASANAPKEDIALRDVSRKLESSFIAEMLKSAGVGKTRDSFGGGAGEDGFSSFLVSAQADMIVESGGFGLAEQIYNSLVQGQKNG
jgi:peptidoglycan hydrolase FlgJ